MSRQILPAKLVGETRQEEFEFLSDLAAGETLSSPVVSVSVYSGTDATPSALLSGSPSVSGSRVLQKLTAGTAGVTYLLKAQATTSTSQVLQRTAFLTVVPDYA